jgi:hypothetical protein
MTQVASHPAKVSFAKGMATQSKKPCGHVNYFRPSEEFSDRIDNCDKLLKARGEFLFGPRTEQECMGFFASLRMTIC